MHTLKHSFELIHAGEVYEVRYPPSMEPGLDAQSGTSGPLSSTEVDALIVELWAAREYAQLWQLCDLLPLHDSQLGLDFTAITALRARCLESPCISVHQTTHRRPTSDATRDTIVDLADLVVPEPVQDDPVHFFECLIKDQHGEPTEGMTSLVEPPNRDSFIRATNEYGLIRFDDLDKPGEYRVTPLPGAGSKGGRPRPMDAEDWFECALVGSSGEALPDQACEVITPDGVAHACKSDSDGLIRIDGLGSIGDCELRFLEAV